MKKILLSIAFAFALVSCRASQWVDSIYLECQNPTRELFYQFCCDNSILYPEVVWAQARLESGNFRSAMYQTKNNCLGLYDSRNRRYMSFSHWTECLIAYRDKVQYRFTGASDNTEVYLSWLVRIGYASDADYVSKIRKMMRKP